MDEDPGEQFHRNEAISAVADEGFLVEEEDDDYEDLYNDVNVGEGFLQTLKRNDEPVVRTAEEVARKIDPPAQFSAPPPPRNVVSQSSGAMVGGGSAIAERGGVEGFENQGPRLPAPPLAGLRVELGQANRNMSGSEELNDGQVQGFVQRPMQQQQPPGGGQGFFPHQQPHSEADTVNLGNEGFARGVNMNVNGINPNGISNAGNAGLAAGGIGVQAAVGGVSGSGGGGGGTMLFVGDLHWWTTDSELEAELSKYGVVKEVKFFDEKASGKSKGYCQVEFYDPGAAAACKEGMNGHVFNGRPCVVAFASPFSVKRMGEAQVNRTQQTGQAALNQPKRVSNDTGGKPAGNNIATGGNYQGGGDNNRGGYGRGNWGRGNSQGMGNRGGAPGGMRRGGGMGGRGIMGNGSNAFNQGMGGNSQMMHPQAMMAQGFDPAFGGPMGRMGGYGGFPGGPMAPFPGMMQSFPPVGGIGMAGVAPHVNPAFFGRGMPMNGMGMVPTSGMDGPNMGMWQDPNMAGWGGEDHPGRGRESSYGEEVASDPQYGDAGYERAGWQGNTKEKDRGSERDWSGSPDRRYREEKEPGFDRDVPNEKDIGPERSYVDSGRHRIEREISRSRDREHSRERERDRDRERDREQDRERDRYRDHRDKDKYADPHKHRDRVPVHDSEWERGRSSRTHSKSRYDDDRRPRSRDADYGKKQRLTSE
uniref:RRM domain-containing protein n=1 Tax=Kalanchoe fedtschenkoi TaxID=63787 RepID=A0A7N0REY4_KALFE